MRGLVLLTALLGAVGVGLGAYQAHGLEKRLTEQGLPAADVIKRVDQCDVAVRYHMVHTLALLTLALSPRIESRRSPTRGQAGDRDASTSGVAKTALAAAVFWLLGIMLFSGGLYSMVFLGEMGHWAIVPSGGLCFILGWCCLGGLAFIRTKTDE